VLYVVDPSHASEKARGHRVDVREDADGCVHIEYRGVVLPACAFAKDAHVNPGAVVENKLLGHTLRMIAAAQRERDETRRNNQRMTLRDEDSLRRAVAASSDPSAQHDPGKRAIKPSTYAPMSLTITPTPQTAPMQTAEYSESSAGQFAPKSNAVVPPTEKRRRDRPRKHALPSAPTTARAHIREPATGESRRRRDQSTRAPAGLGEQQVPDTKSATPVAPIARDDASLANSPQNSTPNDSP
jgi:hypothetical protein